VIERLLLAALLTALPAAAWGSACCVGSTSATAGRLGRCEQAGVTVRLGFEGRTGTWDRDGGFHPASRDIREALSLGIGGALRVDRRFQFGGSLPLRLQRRALDDQEAWGFGPGDLRTWLRWEPLEDVSGPQAPPVPVVGFTVILPTGVPAEASPDPLGAGATGSGLLALGPVLSLERSGARGSFELGGQLVASLPRPGDPHGRAPGLAWTLGVTGAAFLSPSVTLSGSLGADGLSPGLHDGALSGSASIRPTLGAGLALKLRRSGKERLSIGLSGHPPIPGIGRSQESTLALSVSLTAVRLAPWPTRP
jgi:hypothetical protein